jgi:aerobic-type carbon monoxide dehydrogenase small subunit (CoxS/CutS family)
MEQAIEFTLNEKPTRLTTDGERKLLWVLRSDLGLTGSKCGCGEGYCGACLVLLDGEAVRSCLVPIADVHGKTVVTIEGLAQGDKLHPVQAAFLEHDGLQCGFCTPGMIMQAVALLRTNQQPNRAEILEALEPHLCRCGAHVRIIAAVESAAKRLSEGAWS